jgi:phosphatidylglycerol phospholipase C
MPSLKDLLEYLASSELEDIWLLLDIKVPWPIRWEFLRANRINEWAKLDDEADKLMQLLAADLAEVKPTRPWNQRVVLGCWTVSLLYIKQRIS